MEKEFPILIKKEEDPIFPDGRGGSGGRGVVSRVKVRSGDRLTVGGSFGLGGGGVGRSISCSGGSGYDGVGSTIEDILENEVLNEIAEGSVQERAAKFGGGVRSNCDLRLMEEQKNKMEKRMRRISNQETTSDAQLEVQILRENMKR